MSWAYIIRPGERDLFRRCRRAWDFGARSRRDLEPRQGGPPDLARALREALAVYYFPGMWTWSREIVKPLALEALRRSLEEQGAGAPHAWPSSSSCGGLLEAYFPYAESADHFEPLKVEAEFTANLPDPGRPGTDLTTPEGEPIRYRGRIPLIVVESGVQWIVEHRLRQGSFADPDELRLSERGALDCWAYEASFLGAKVAGVVFNELLLGDRPSFRRTRAPKSEAERERRRRDLAAEAREMTDSTLALYPSPSPEHCPRCPFLEPCLAMNEGGDAAPILEARFQRRLREDESRIGQVSWSLGRGAAPPRRP
jgi:hypothetical protein